MVRGVCHGLQWVGCGRSRAKDRCAVALVARVTCRCCSGVPPCMSQSVPWKGAAPLRSRTRMGIQPASVARPPMPTSLSILMRLLAPLARVCGGVADGDSCACARGGSPRRHNTTMATAVALAAVAGGAVPALRREATVADRRRPALTAQATARRPKNRVLGRADGWWRIIVSAIRKL